MTTTLPPPTPAGCVLGTLVVGHGRSVLDRFPLACPHRAAVLERALSGDRVAWETVLAGTRRVLGVRRRAAEQPAAAGLAGDGALIVALPASDDPVPVCVECGDDLAADGQQMCLDCLEAPRGGVRHLAGKHDQKSHGGGGGVRAFTDEELAAARDGIIAEYGSEAAATSARGYLDDAALFDLAGYSGKPTVLAPEEFDAFQGATLAYGRNGRPRDEFARGVGGTRSIGAERAARSLLEGDEYWVGHGVFTNGIYIGDEYAGSFFNGGGHHDHSSVVPPSSDPKTYAMWMGESAYLRVKLAPDTRVVDWGDIPVRTTYDGEHVPEQAPSAVINRWAVEHGYHVINTSRNNDRLSGVVVLDRSKLVVEALQPGAGGDGRSGLRAVVDDGDGEILMTPDESRALALVVNRDPSTRPGILERGWAALDEETAAWAEEQFAARYGGPIRHSLEEHAEQVRHLPGKHDQKSHGRGGGSAVESAIANVYQGGATLDPLHGFDSPTSGICVARQSSRVSADGVPNGLIVPASDFFAGKGRGAEIVKQYLRDRESTFTTPGEFGTPKLGLWHDTEHGEVAIDVVDVVPSSRKDAALRMGRDQNQQAVFDLDTFEEIVTGGDGRARVDGGPRRPEGLLRDDAGGAGRVLRGDRGADAPVAGLTSTVRHLAGKHDQKTHAGGRLSTGVQSGTKTREKNPVDGPDGTDWGAVSEATRRKAGEKFAELGLPVTADGLPDVDAMAANILESYALAGTTDVRYGEEFYSSAHNDARDMAHTMGVSEEVGAAALARLSPQMAWENNVAWGHHVARMVADDPVVDAAFLAGKAHLGGEPRTVGDLIARDGFSLTLGKRLSEYSLKEQASIIAAAGKRPMTAVATGGPKAGRTINANYVSNGNIEGALKIIRSDGSLQAISGELGGHKIRSFYNNILTSAKADGPVTIDSHAFDIAILGGASQHGKAHVTDAQKMVLTNWAVVSEGVKGLGYAPVAEAYRRATVTVNSQRKAAGLVPLTVGEVQAVSWMTTLD